jgi:hypothetical protein
MRRMFSRVGHLNGKYDACCLSCFKVIRDVPTRAILEELEAQHVCAPEDKARYAPKLNPAIKPLYCIFCERAGGRSKPN